MTAEISEDIFQMASRTSGFWLPVVLDALVKVPQAFCQADSCSIYLRWPAEVAQPVLPLLHLAATTRDENKRHLFDREHSYEVNPDSYWMAAQDAAVTAIKDPAKAGMSQTGRVGLTGWVATFNEVLRIVNLHDWRERDQLAKTLALPMPVWSPLNRHYYDADVSCPKPLLIVPIADRIVRRPRNRSGENERRSVAFGAIRVSTLRQRPRSFSDDALNRLCDFAEALYRFLVDRRALGEPGLDHYFRIWASRGTADVAERVTAAVPDVCRVNSCALFLRSRHGTQYVLRDAHASGLDNKAIDRFNRFREGNRNKLYYEENDEARTTTCLKEHAAVLLRLRSDDRWERVPASLGSLPSTDGAAAGEGASDGRGEDSRPRSDAPGEPDPHGRYLVEVDPSVPRCEFEKTPAFMALVPIRDMGRPRQYVGVLRAVSVTSEDGRASEILNKLELFGDALATVLETSWPHDVERSLRAVLMQLMHGKSENWLLKASQAIEAIGEALDAGAATLWFRVGDKLYSRPELCWLASKYQSQTAFLDLHAFHMRFRDALWPYEIGTGRTGWVAKYGDVVNLKNAGDPHGMGADPQKPYIPSYRQCEFHLPGPLLVVPVMLGPNRSIDGVIRVIRRKDTSHGEFSSAHEEILVNSAQFLAEILREGRPWKAVVSYKSGIDDHLRHVVAGWVKDFGGEVLSLPVPDVTAAEAADRFASFCLEATLAITIATPADQTGKLSDEMKAEFMKFGVTDHLKKRHIVFHRIDAELPTTAMSHHDFVRFEFTPQIDAIMVLYRKFLSTLREWGLVRIG
ncbi:MAG TPA: hypothetical protein VKU41_08195 [Polyangiaceae bacterium]|nr:hypothetical protein [Polyangiaceae bacterium]